MDFDFIVQDLKTKKLAGRRFQNSSNTRFRDSVTVRQDGRLTFQRFNLGEAAGHVCTMEAPGLAADGTIAWAYDSCEYSKKDEAPKELTGTEGQALLFDGKKALWQPMADLKTLPGLGRLKMLFSK